MEMTHYLTTQGDDPIHKWPPTPTTFEDYEDGTETTHIIAVPMNYPPYPWVEEVKLGMGMGRYFANVELMEETEATEDQPGTYTFRFYQGEAETTCVPRAFEMDDDDLPY